MPSLSRLLCRCLTVVCFLGISISGSAVAAVGDITTVIGNGVGDSAPATDALLAGPAGVAVDYSGNVYIADTNAHRVRKIDVNGVITTIAGTGFAGFSGDGGLATQAQLNLPYDVAVGGFGDLYIADYGNHRIRKIDAQGYITTVAGTGSAGFSGDSGAATAATINAPMGIAWNSNNLYIADTLNHRIRKVTAGGTITTYAGTGSGGYSGDSGPATSAQLNSPRGIDMDDSGRLYIADWGNSRVRKVAADGTITTFAGTGVAGDSGDVGLAVNAQLNRPRDVDFYWDTLYIVDESAQRARYVDGGGVIFGLAGDGSQGFAGDGGAAVAAQLDSPAGIAVSTAGDIYLADTGNYRIRKTRINATISTFAGIGATSFGGDGGTASLAKLDTPSGMVVDSQGNTYVVDRSNHRIRKVAADGTISTIAGTGVAGYSGDNGPAIAAQLNLPAAIAIDSSDNLYVADSSNHRVRMIDGNGTISTVAGTGVSGYNGDGIDAATAQLATPIDVAVDGQDNLYIADYANDRLRKVSAGVITTVAGTGVAGFSGDGSAATSAQLDGVRGMAFDSSGALYFVDEYNFRIRKIDGLGTITTVAGTGVDGFGGDGGAATSAQLSYPADLAIDDMDTVYVADWNNHRIRKITADGTIATLAGTGEQGYSGDGGAGSSARLNYPTDVTLDGDGHLLVAGYNNVVRRIEGNLAPSNVRLISANVYEESDTTSPLLAGQILSDDPNAGDSHTYTLTGGADQASFQLQGSFLYFNAGVVLQYEIQNRYEVEVTATDVGGRSLAKTLYFDLLNVNDPLQGSLSFTGSLIEHQTLTVDTSGLSDADGLGTFSYQWLRAGRVISGATAASYVLSGDDVNATVGVQVSYVDGGGFSESVTAEDGTVLGDLDGDLVLDSVDDDVDGDGMSNSFEQSYGLNPRAAGDGAIDSDGDGRSNLDEFLAGGNPTKDDVPPVITLPDDLLVAATGLRTKVDFGLATAVDTVDGVVEPLVDVSEPYFAPGTHLLTWTAVDSGGNRAEAQQLLQVLPLVNFGPDRPVVEGNQVTVELRLNGPAPIYPISVPFQLGGTATAGEDYDLVAGEVVFAEGEERAEITFNVLDDGVVDPAETLILTMGEPVNAVAGVEQSLTLTLAEGNLAPRVTLAASQADKATRIVTRSGGQVVVSALVEDPNTADVHSYGWAATDNALVDLDGEDARFSFDPLGVAAGFYELRVTVSDGALSSDARLILQVVDQAPALQQRDSDGDGVQDTEEGFGDSDGDGIPDYLDAIDQRHVLQSSRGEGSQYLLEVEPGLRLSLGLVALKASGGQAGVSQNDVANYSDTGLNDSDYFYNGGMYDFDVDGLAGVGSSATVVLPQLNKIPTGAVYRKLTPAGWSVFYEDDKNRLASAKGEQGYCPPPGDAAYTTGLTAGYWCVQLTIEDGGPNDADGLANLRVEDPGGIAQHRSAPVQTQTSVSNSSGASGGGAALWLSLILLLRRRLPRS